MEPPPPPHPESYTRDLLSRALAHMKDPLLIEAVAVYLVSGALETRAPHSFPDTYIHNRRSPADWWAMSILCWPALYSANRDPWNSLGDYITLFHPHDHTRSENP